MALTSLMVMMVTGGRMSTTEAGSAFGAFVGVGSCGVHESCGIASGRVSLPSQVTQSQAYPSQRLVPQEESQ